MIKLLILAANPRDTNPLRLGEEVREIESKIRESSAASRFTVRSAWAVTADELMYQLNSFQPNIVHFIGHGSRSGEIVLEDTNGKSQPVAPSALKVVFANFRQWIQVVLLNACYSAPQAESLAENVDVVIGMADSVVDDAAIEFSASFYRALGFGRSIEDAFGQGVASLALRGLGGEHVPKLIHRAGVNPRLLTLAGASDVAIGIRRAEDSRVPRNLRKLLHEGCEFLLLTDESVRLQKIHSAEEHHIFLALKMRQSNVVFVVEVNRFASTEVAATELARRLLPVDSHQYEWALIKNEDILPSELSLTMAGVKSGDFVRLVGNHRQPEWAPYISGP